MEHNFTLRFVLADVQGDELMAPLEEAGCTDALVGLGSPGHVTLDFTREADSLSAAILGALEQTQRAMPAAVLAEAGPFGIASREEMQARTIATASGEFLPEPGAPKTWVTSAESLIQLLSEGNPILLAQIARNTS